MASRFKTVTIEEVTDRTGTKNSKGILVKKLRKLRTLAKVYALNENCILLNVLGFRCDKLVKTIPVVSVIFHPGH